MKAKHFYFLFTLILTMVCYSCKNNSDWDHSAAILIKGKEVKMTMYGSYYNAIQQWDEVKAILDKVAETHSAKIVLIRVIDPDKKSDDLISNYIIRKVEKYLKSLDVEFKIRDERTK